VPSAANPWQSGVPSPANPWQSGVPSPANPWQSGVPSPANPWQSGVPLASNPWQYQPYAFGSPYSDMINTQTGLAPVDIEVVSDLTKLNENTGDKKVQITWNSAEELADALFPNEQKTNIAKIQELHAEALGDHKVHIETMKGVNKKISKTLSTHAEALSNHKDAIEEQHKKTSKQIKEQDTVLRQQSSILDDYKVKVGSHHRVLANHKDSIQALAAKVDGQGAIVHKTNAKIETLTSKVLFDNNHMKKQSAALLQHKEVLQVMTRDIDTIKRKIDTNSKMTDVDDQKRNIAQRSVNKMEGSTKKMQKNPISAVQEVDFSFLTPPRRKK
jgi:hypothetical protein